MNTQRHWVLCAASVAALSFGPDAAADKPLHRFPGAPDMSPGWARQGFATNPSSKGVSAPGMPGSSGSGRAQSANNSGSNGHSSGHKGKDKKDAPGENIQASASESESRSAKRRPLHEIPTCE